MSNNTKSYAYILIIKMMKYGKYDNMMFFLITIYLHYIVIFCLL